MLQYLIILLDETSTSYCYYNNPRTKRKLISEETLKTAIIFAMKENLQIQFVYPSYVLPSNYQELIETVDHSKICPDSQTDVQADVVVFNDWEHFINYPFRPDTTYVFRIKKDDFFQKYSFIIDVLPKITRLNVTVTDIETFGEKDLENYRLTLQQFSNIIEKLYLQGKNIQFNLLTDRMMLNHMNNCDAGWRNITLAPNGKFYVCPAFYLADADNHIGDLLAGVHVNNPQLYQLDYAPICRRCDAFQCRRCMWLNKKTTLEINTPSHEQCAVSHIERNASRALLHKIREQRDFLKGYDIKKISYSDPFEISKRF